MQRRIPLLLISALALLGAKGSAAAVPPPKRDLAEVKAVLARSPKHEIYRKSRPLNVLLVANRKDHGPHEHDYPRWMERWKVLLGGKSTGTDPVTLYGPTAGLPLAGGPGLPNVKVETAKDWPTPEQLRRADLVVANMGTGGIWNEAKLSDLKALLDRGAGFVALHAAVIAEKPHARPLADLLGLAWEGGYTLFRHGPLDLKITDREHPITQGLPETIHFEDESYWPLVGDASRVKVLGTADEAERGTGQLKPYPMFWTHTVGKGRVFNSILGHYTWTFDDPYYRLLVLRGMAWAAGEDPYRFDRLALVGARVTDQKAVVAKAAEAPAKTPPAAPVAPDAGDANLLLWLDAADRASITAAANGRVTAWASKSGRVKARLTSDGDQQPLLVAQGLGGKPAIRFDGTNDVLRDLAFRQVAGEWTIALVTTPRSNAGTFRAMLAANRPGIPDFQSGFNIDMGPGASATFNAVNLEGIKGGGATNLRTDSAAFGSGQVLILSTGSGSSRLWVNGNEEEARGASDALTVMDELRVGGRFYFGAEQGYYHGDISEVLIYRTRLTEEQRAGLTAHLIQKYGPEIKPPTVVDIDPWDYLPIYDWSGTRRPLVAIDEAVARAKSDRRLRASLEIKLAEIAADPANTAAARDFACRRLAIVGSSASVPALAKLLAEPALTPMACFALERIPGTKAEQALVNGLGRAPGRSRIEIINALGGRRSQAGVAGLAPLLRDSDASIRGATARALGSIGGVSAVSHLIGVLGAGSGADQTAVAGALLYAAEEAMEAGRKAEAVEIYMRLTAADVPLEARRAAVRASILMRGASGGHLIVEQLNSTDPATQAMALLLVREHLAGETGGRELTVRIASGLNHLKPEAQAKLITSLADRGDAAAAPGIRVVLKSSDPAVRQAAIFALGRLGDANDVPELLLLADGSDRELATAAMSSLASLSGAGVDVLLLRAAEHGEGAGKRAAIEALGRRGYLPATPVLIRLASGKDPVQRSAAIQALGETALIADVPALAELLIRTEDPRDAAAAEKTLTTVYGRIEEKERWAEVLLAKQGGANAEAKAGLLRLLSQHGGPKALQAVREALGDKDPDVREEALGLLADWESPEAAPDLMKIILDSTTDRVQRTLALRGYIRIAGLPGVDPARRMTMANEAIARAERDEEKKMALAVLGTVPEPSALRRAIVYMERPTLAEEAGAAAVAIALKLRPNQAALVADAMKKVIASVKNPEVLRQAADLRARAEQAGR